MCENIIADRGLHQTFCGTIFVSWILFKCNLQPEKTLLINRRITKLENLHILLKTSAKVSCFHFLLTLNQNSKGLFYIKKIFFLEKNWNLRGG